MRGPGRLQRSDWEILERGNEDAPCRRQADEDRTGQDCRGEERRGYGGQVNQRRTVRLEGRQAEQRVSSYGIYGMWPAQEGQKLLTGRIQIMLMRMIRTLDILEEYVKKLRGSRSRSLGNQKSS